MTFVASTIPNLVSGVSQQPAPSRLKTSGEEMINAFPSVVAGLMKRPPTEFVRGLPTNLSTTGSVGVHVINRSPSEKYILVCGESDLELYDELGNKQTVTFPDGKSYLPSNSVWQSLRFVTVADTTFILNTQKIVGSSPVPDNRVDPKTRGSVFIKRAVANVNYAIYVNNQLAGVFQTSDNTTASTALEGTSEIASGLASSMRSNGYTDAEALGTTVTFGINSGDTLQVDDQFGGSALESYTDSLQEFSDLPPIEDEGRLIRIQGNLEDQGSSYWVEYNNGIWTETFGYDEGQELDSATMPHILVKTGSNTFEFRKNVWKGRIAGDSESNPDPSFVNQNLNNMFLFKGRLGLLSGENVILSEVALLENFYRTTVIQLLSSDVIDVASTTGRVSTLYHATSFSDELILFSDKEQFRLSSGGVLSPETVGITNSTGYPCSTLVAPVTSGASAYFVSPGATHSGAREIFIDGLRETVNGENIGVQVPTYIPKNIRGMVTSSTADVFLVLSEDEPNEVYVYKWYTTQREKIQSAWCKWSFDSERQIVGMGFLDDYLYLIYRRGNNLFMDRMLVGFEIDKELLLDSQFTNEDFVSASYNSASDRTEIEIPYAINGDISFCRSGGGRGDPYTAVTKTSNTTYEIVGDVTGHSITAGINYEFLYEFSTQYLREQKAEGESALQDGRLQLRYFSVLYTNTSYFETHVTPDNGETSVAVFNGRVLGDPDNIPDEIPRDTGEFKFPVFAENEHVTIQVKSNQPYRCALGSVEWTAIYKQKARRM